MRKQSPLSGCVTIESLSRHISRNYRKMCGKYLVLFLASNYHNGIQWTNDTTFQNSKCFQFAALNLTQLGYCVTKVNICDAVVVLLLYCALCQFDCNHLMLCFGRMQPGKQPPPLLKPSQPPSMPPHPIRTLLPSSNLCRAARWAPTATTTSCPVLGWRWGHILAPLTPSSTLLSCGRTSWSYSTASLLNNCGY